MNGKAATVWAGYAALLALAAAPIFSTILPPLFDYPNHLARMHLLAEGGDRYYAVRWGWLPNLAEDLIVPGASRIFGLALAGKLFLVASFALTMGGVLWLGRVATGGWRLWPLLGFALLYNRIFLWGFVNYLFGVGVAIAGVALWLALERRAAWLRILASVLVALACWFSHVAAFGFYALVIFGVELLPALGEWRRAEGGALLRRICVGLPQFLLPIGFFLVTWQPDSGVGFSYAGYWRKADLLFSVFDNYNRSFDAACFAGFVGLLLWLAWRRRLGLAPRLATACGIVFLVYLIMPSQLYTGSGADHRLPAPLFLLLVAASAPRFPSRRIASVIAVAATAILVLRFSIIERVWRQSDRIYRADLAGLAALPEGAKLAVAFPASAIHVVHIPEVHLPTLAIVERDAFVPTLFAYPAQQPILLRPPYDALAAATGPQDLWAAFVERDATRRKAVLPVLARYDYVVFTDRGPVPVLEDPCLATVFDGASFRIFRVVHDVPGCGGTAGRD